jgi:phosphatidylglycerophosphate synthase
MEAQAPAVSAPLAQLPNALTIARLALIPVFVVLMVQAGPNSSWPAGSRLRHRTRYTDQVDGLARAAGRRVAFATARRPARRAG